MITYRNELWNIIIKLLKEMKDYKYFREIENGRFANRISLIYERATRRLSISSTDWKLMIDTMLTYINEKDITDEMREVFDEAEILDMKSMTSSDGARVYKLALASLIDRKKKADINKKLEEAERIYEEKRLEHEKFMIDQEKTLLEAEEARNKLKELKKELNKINMETEREAEEKASKKIKQKKINQTTEQVSEGGKDE